MFAQLGGKFAATNIRNKYTRICNYFGKFVSSPILALCFSSRLLENMKI